MTAPQDEHTTEIDAGRIADLRAVVAAASPGPWSEYVLGSEGYDVRAPNPDHPLRRLRIARCGYEAWEVDRANAEFIATFDPYMIAALLDEIEDLQTRVIPSGKGGDQ